MMKTSVRTAAIAAALFSAVQAYVPDQPAATRSFELPNDGFSPRPTQPPPNPMELKRSIAARRVEDPDEIVFVGDSNTCGYIDGSENSWYSCAASATCAHRTSTQGGAVGDILCCISGECFSTLACINGADYSASCDENCRLDPDTLKCTATSYSFCNRVDLPNGVADLFCDTTARTTPLTADTTYSGQETNEFSRTPLGALMDIQTSSEASSEATTATESETGSSSSTSSTPTSTNTDNSDDGGAPIGAIVGGSVGGVAAIALAGLGIFFVRRNSKKKEAKAASPFSGSPGQAMPPMAQNSPPAAPGYPPGYSPGAPSPQQQTSYYDPKFMAAAHPQHPQPGYQYQMVPGQVPYQPASSYNSTSPGVDPHQSVYSNISPTHQQGPYPPPGQQPGQVWAPQGGVIHEAPNTQADTSRASELA
jgi:hypothetical protein